MEESENKERREDIFSKVVRAGKRTYFFDVKEMKSGEYYLTITESKRRFDNDHGKFYYEKHKLFLYKEDFERFSDAFKETLEFIKTENASDEPIENNTKDADKTKVDVKFEDLKSDNNEE